MKKSRFVVLSVAFILALALSWLAPSPAMARPADAQFVSARAACTSGSYVFSAPTIGVNAAPAAFRTVSLKAVPMPFMVRAVDADGTLLGSAMHGFAPGMISGSITFARPASGATVTFELYDAYYFTGKSSAMLRLDGIPGLLDTITVPSGCGGCDLAFSLSKAVSGAFVAPAPVYWAPSYDKKTGLTIAAGKTFYTFGVDETGDFRQVLLACTLVWVPADTMGPNFDAVWNGAPLPMTVID